MEELIPHLANLKNADGSTAFDAANDPIFKAALEEFKSAQNAQTELANLKQQEANAKEKYKKEKDAETSQKETSDKKIEGKADNPTLSATTSTEKTTSPKYMTEADLDAYMSRSFNNHVPKLLEKQLKPLLDSVSELKNEGVAQYKARLLRENADTIIPEMLKGTSKAELDAALIEAKAVHAKYIKKDEPKAPANTNTNGQNNAQKLPVVPIGGNSGQANAPLNIKDMDAKTYAEKRSELLAKARSGQLT